MNTVSQKQTHTPRTDQIIADIAAIPRMMGDNELREHARELERENAALMAACRSAINDLEFRANYDESNRLRKTAGQENFWMRSHIAGTRVVVAEIRAAIAKATEGTA